ncbi:MAG: JAB domain-containing protein [Alphaproteobacteria bacterium]|nr:JAB domain-containing protein [Alphaproteobacteria bacterium]
MRDGPKNGSGGKVVPLFGPTAPGAPAPVRPERGGVPDDGERLKKQRQGHRERLRRHFLKNLHGDIRMRDYELLELLLFGAYPRRDVQQLARDLIETFGSLASVLAAEPAALLKVRDVGEAAVSLIKVAEALGVELAREGAVSGEVLGNYDAVIAYCRARMGRKPVEEFRVLFLDNRNRLLRDERQTTGTINHTPAYPREVCRRALEVGAVSIILVHNHPSGDPTPSRSDIETTRRIDAAAKTLGISVHDHLIVTRGETLSFKTKGLL